MLLLGAAEGGFLTEDTAVAIGLALLLAIVAAGVLIAMLRGARMRAFEDIEQGEVTATSAVRRYAGQLRSTGSSTWNKAAALALFILSPLCVFLPALLAEERTRTDAGGPTLLGADQLILFGAVGTLAVIALGLFCWIAPNADGRAAEHLHPAHDPQDDPDHSRSTAIRVVAALWWSITLAVFLIWGLGFNGWGQAWAVWPVSAVLYGGLWALNSALNRDTEQARGSAAR